MKVLIIGLGSMGRRRISLIQKYYKNLIILGVDLNEERCKFVSNKFNIKTYNTIELAVNNEKPECAFICTSPSNHPQITLYCIENKLNIFSEINLISKHYEKIMKQAKEVGVKIFLSSTFLYRNEIRYIAKQISEINCKISYRYHVGQYLPDWHPWESYKDFFVANKRTNGCRELMAIEFPWIIKTFGKIEEVFSISNKITNLNLDYDDNYTIVIQHKNGNIGTINMDLASRRSIRSLEVYNEDIYLTWGGTPETLSIYDINQKVVKSINTYEEIERDAKYSSNIIENAYLKEIEVFFDYVINNKSNEVKYTFEEDLYTLSIIDEIEGVK
jgi:predicted dehydrogenase